jgi:hypothetical protein
MAIEIEKTVTVEVDLHEFDSEEVCTYVAENWGVDDVYSRDDIIDFCRSEFELEELYNIAHVQDYCTDQKPEDIFSEAVLADWANRHGWKGPN